MLRGCQRGLQEVEPEWREHLDRSFLAIDKGEPAKYIDRRARLSYAREGILQSTLSNSTWEGCDRLEYTTSCGPQISNCRTAERELDGVLQTLVIICLQHTYLAIIPCLQQRLFIPPVLAYGSGKQIN